MTKRQNASSSPADMTAIAEPENLRPKSETSEPEADSLDNAALRRCVKAWHRNFNLASINPSDDRLNSLDSGADTVFASEQGALAFCEAMTLLVSYENIRDFIACITMACSSRCSIRTSAASFSVQPKSPRPSSRRSPNRRPRPHDFFLKTALFSVQNGRFLAIVY